MGHALGFDFLMVRFYFPTRPPPQERPALGAQDSPEHACPRAKPYSLPVSLGEVALAVKECCPAEHSFMQLWGTHGAPVQSSQQLGPWSINAPFQGDKGSSLDTLPGSGNIILCPKPLECSAPKSHVLERRKPGEVKQCWFPKCSLRFQGKPTIGKVNSACQ